MDYFSRPHPAESGLLCVLTECVLAETQSFALRVFAHDLNIYEESIHKVVLYAKIYIYICLHDCYFDSWFHDDMLVFISIAISI